MSYFAISNLYRDRKWDGLQGQVMIEIDEVLGSQFFSITNKEIESLEKEDLVKLARERINEALKKATENF